MEEDVDENSCKNIILLDEIETISLEEEFKINPEEHIKYYVTLINCIFTKLKWSQCDNPNTATAIKFNGIYLTPMVGINIQFSEF